ncbi:MAG: hypothetical protein IPG42_05010 [Betaproteobacteria bacterium]|nr:hypothetical protein [Betaproteobacteria bacterium]MBK7655010.1 hypothetical protein [Betaproteobacteria bacterium]MBP7780060.1 hypothetical protein [Burkholderiaceae bacterium]
MIPVKTEKGLSVLKDRSVRLMPRQRSAFVLCDGKRRIEEIMELTKALGVTQDDINLLFQEGLLNDGLRLPEASSPDADDVSVPISSLSRRSRQQRYQDAYPEAIRLTASLGLRGFRLNLAVEAASGYEQLKELAPRIREAVGEQAFEPLGKALLG